MRKLIFSILTLACIGSLSAQDKKAGNPFLWEKGNATINPGGYVLG